jgi:PKHD-type hydroxylase
MTQIEEEVIKMESPFFDLYSKKYAPSTCITTPIFTKKEIDNIKFLGDICLEKQNNKATINGKPTNDDYRICDIAWLQVNHITLPIYNKISSAIHLVNKELFNYDLTTIETLQYTKYEATTQGCYKKHIDMAYGDGPKDCRKLSFSVQLSDPSEYSGGELWLHHNSTPEIANKKLGIITFFSSYVMHEVTPVTEGIRHSLVGWVRGPAFK